VVGILADPDLPGDFARRLTADLQASPDGADGRVSWRVGVLRDPFTSSEPRADQIVDLAREWMRRQAWERAICLTDLPLRVQRQPLVAEVRPDAGVAVVSLPALGATRLFGRVREAILWLEGELTRQGGHGGPGGKRPPAFRFAVQRAGPPDASQADLRLLASPVLGQLRMLTEMVRANRPWRLVLGLSRVLAVALATSALALTQDTIWQMGDSLGVPRLAVAAAGSVTAMLVWLVADHELWERRSGPAARNGEPVRLYNAATVTTVLLGVGCLFVALLAINLLAAEFLLSGSLLRSTLQHPVDITDYLELAWITSSAAVVGGALGSGLESDQVVRKAAYGNRELERRSDQDAAAGA
jgi:hypothetical protein